MRRKYSLVIEQWSNLRNCLKIPVHPFLLFNRVASFQRNILILTLTAPLRVVPQSSRRNGGDTRNRALGFVHLKLQNMGWPDLHSGQQGPRGFVAVQQCSNTGLPKNYLLLFVERFFKNRSGLPKSQLKVDF